MRPRILLLPALLALLPGALAAQARTTESPAAPASAPAARPTGAATQPRLPPTVSAPITLQGQTAARPLEPAPVPNREIQAPRDRFANNRNPSLEPLLLSPDRRQGMTFGSEHLRETGPDRPLDNLVPGARLRIPLE